MDKRTAIVLTDENLLIPLLHSLPESVDSVNVTMGYPIKTTLAYTFVERLFALQAHSRAKEEGAKFYYADVMELLSHPYIMDNRRELCLKLSQDITANRAGVSSVAVFFTSRVGYDCFVIVTECVKFITDVLVTADGADALGIVGGVLTGGVVQLVAQLQGAVGILGAAFGLDQHMAHIHQLAAFLGIYLISTREPAFFHLILL